MKEKIANKVLTTKDKSKMCLHERMRHYQDIEKDEAFNPEQSVLIIRVLFKNIKRFSKVFEKPFDYKANQLMRETADLLLINFKGKYAHIGIDEITLVIHGTEKEPIGFGGKKQKLVSSITSVATGYYAVKLAERFDVDAINDRSIFPTFETTIYSLPTRTEACNVLLWRERDNVKTCLNSIFSHLELNKNIEGKSHIEQVNYLVSEYNFDWDNVDSLFKNGSYLKRVRIHFEDEKYPRHTTEIDYKTFSNSTIDERVRRIFS